MKDYAKKLGENLKKIRTKKNITQTELAETLNVDKSGLDGVRYVVILEYFALLKPL